MLIKDRLDRHSLAGDIVAPLIECAHAAARDFPDDPIAVQDHFAWSDCAGIAAGSARRAHGRSTRFIDAMKFPIPLREGPNTVPLKGNIM